ncbi:hypothetical protein ACFZ8E_09100 [Methylobacterium sp. HMF5984]|uniref:hypothetical protein n=1 Tax=Methylobacterium sp. HMF5984 TaxID=3367370 RepID=UPI003851DC9C
MSGLTPKADCIELCRTPKRYCHGRRCDETSGPADHRTLAVPSAGMIRVIKHILIEPTADRADRIESIRTVILAAFPDATTEIVPGLLDDDLVVEVRVPLWQLDE